MLITSFYKPLIFKSKREYSTQTHQLKRPRRTLFYCPGSEEKKIAKAASLDVDILVLDVEDGVAHSKKITARSNILSYYKSSEVNLTEKCVRINGLDTQEQSEDLNMLQHVLDNIDSILIPKVETPKDIVVIDEFLKSNDNHNVKLLATIESSKGLVNLKEICQSSQKLDALVFGGEDFCADTSITRSSDATELLYARSKIVTYAKCFNMQAIDFVCIDFKNLDQLRNECLQGHSLGFDGKQAIHPSQVPIINELMVPSKDVTEFADKILKAYEEFDSKGKGAFEVEGIVIDMPMVKWAMSILKKSRPL